MQEAIDISNWQGDPSSDVFVRWAAEGVRTVICGTMGNPDYPLVYEQQATKAMNAGLEVEAYVWLVWDNADPGARLSWYLDLVQQCPWVRRVWLDCEQTDGWQDAASTVSLIAQAREQVKARGLEVGIYTGAWWWQPYTDNEGGFWDLPLWLADYDYRPTLESAHLPLGGWTSLHRKQYTDKGTKGGIYPLDLNVELDTPLAPAPPPGVDDFTRGRQEVIGEVERQVASWRGAWGIPPG